MTTTTLIDVDTLNKVYVKQAYGRELEFISHIRGDGKLITLLEKDMSVLDDTLFTLTSLSITYHTYIASEFHSYVVKLK